MAAAARTAAIAPRHTFQPPRARPKQWKPFFVWQSLPACGRAPAENLLTRAKLMPFSFWLPFRSWTPFGGLRIFDLAPLYTSLVRPAKVILGGKQPQREFTEATWRESLHELVWTAPVIEVAKRLGVSDVGLAKRCRRAEIPTPGRGYWARVESGRRIGRVPLPPAPGGLPSLPRIRGIE